MGNPRDEVADEGNQRLHRRGDDGRQDDRVRDAFEFGKELAGPAVLERGHVVYPGDEPVAVEQEEV